MIKFIFLIMMSFAVSATDQLTWTKAELRKDGSKIKTIEKYLLYHWYENILQPVIEIDGADIIYSDTDRRVGIHVYEISTVEAGQEGRRSYPASYYIAPNAEPIRFLLTLEKVE